MYQPNTSPMLQHGMAFVIGLVIIATMFVGNMVGSITSVFEWTTIILALAIMLVSFWGFINETSEDTEKEEEEKKDAQ